VSATTIEYVVGDATDPIGDGPKLIAHIVNDVGAWGAGFAKALSARWNEPERDYREWWLHQGLYQHVPFGLGNARFTAAGAVWVASMIAQHGLIGRGNPHPIRYDALARALGQVGGFAKERGASVHLPRIGCGLAGGTWNLVEPIVERELCGRGVHVTVYDLPAGA
jgi:O-acetyl-ADP-ribose deacetylase (regulator of RNase III)